MIGRIWRGRERTEDVLPLVYHVIKQETPEGATPRADAMPTRPTIAGVDGVVTSTTWRPPIPCDNWRPANVSATNA